MVTTIYINEKMADEFIKVSKMVHSPEKRMDIRPDFPSQKKKRSSLALQQHLQLLFLWRANRMER